MVNERLNREQEIAHDQPTNEDMKIPNGFYAHNKIWFRMCEIEIRFWKVNLIRRVGEWSFIDSKCHLTWRKKKSCWKLFLLAIQNYYHWSQMRVKSRWIQRTEARLIRVKNMEWGVKIFPASPYTSCFSSAVASWRVGHWLSYWAFTKCIQHLPRCAYYTIRLVGGTCNTVLKSDSIKYLFK